MLLGQWSSWWLVEWTCVSLMLQDRTRESLVILRVPSHEKWEVHYPHHFHAPSSPMWDTGNLFMNWVAMPLLLLSMGHARVGVVCS